MAFKKDFIIKAFSEMNDERSDFKPSVIFLIKSQNCKLAYDELIQYQNMVMGKSVFSVVGKIPHLKESFNLQAFNLQAFNYAGFDKFY
jgi:hypothetical protein